MIGASTGAQRTTNTSMVSAAGTCHSLLWLRAAHISAAVPRAAKNKAPPKGRMQYTPSTVHRIAVPDAIGTHQCRQMNTVDHRMTILLCFCKCISDILWLRHSRVFKHNAVVCHLRHNSNPFGAARASSCATTGSSCGCFLEQGCYLCTVRDRKNLFKGHEKFVLY